MKKPQRTLEQNKIMWALIGDLGLGEDALRDVVFFYTRQRSTKALTVDQARQVINSLVELQKGGGDFPLPSGERTKVRGKRGIITQEQQEYIYRLFQQLGWTESSRRTGFTKKQLKGKAWPQTNTEAGKLIQALKNMLKRHQGGHYDRRQKV